MMISGLKYPNLLVYQRVEGYKSTANFITSLDYENLSKFAKKQDEYATIKPRASEKIKTENKFEKHETKYQFSKPKEGFLKQETGYPYTLEAKNPISLDSNQPEDYSYKSSTPLSKKYESLETKGSFDRLNYLPSQEKPKNRLEIPKAPLRKEGNFENIEKNYSPRTKKEDSFRSWDKPNEMDRIGLGSPKESEERPTRTFSRQEEPYPKLSFTPQRNFSKDSERFSHFSSKEDNEKNYSASPYFQEKYSFKEKYPELLEDNLYKEKTDDKLDENHEFQFVERKNFQENENLRDFKYHPRQLDYKDIKDYKTEVKEDEFKQKELYGKEIVQGSKNFEEFNKNKELPTRSYKSTLESIEKDPVSRNYISKYYKTEENSQKNPYSLDQKEKYSIKDDPDDQTYKETQENFQNRPKDSKISEENIAIKGYKYEEDPHSQDMQNERSRLREYKFTEEEDIYKPKNYSTEIEDQRAYYKNDQDYDREKIIDYKHSEEIEYKGELRAKDLKINDSVDYYKDIKSQVNNEFTTEFKYTKPERKSLANEEEIHKNYKAYDPVDIYEKYKPGNYRVKTEELASEVSYYKEEEFNPRSELSKNRSEDFRSKYQLNRLPETASEPQKEDNKYSYKDQYSLKEEKPGLYNIKQFETYNDESKRTFKSFKTDDTPSLLPGDSGKTNEFNEWNCTKCNKKVQGNLYECSDCRLINWDQFYKVKALQHAKIKSDDGGKAYPGIESLKKEEPRRLYSFSDVKDETQEWVCVSCSTSNKNIFFLCKNCRKPRTHSKEQDGMENIRK